MGSWQPGRAGGRALRFALPVASLLPSRASLRNALATRWHRATISLLAHTCKRLPFSPSPSSPSPPSSLATNSAGCQSARRTGSCCTLSRLTQQQHECLRSRRSSSSRARPALGGLIGRLPRTPREAEGWNLGFFFFRGTCLFGGDLARTQAASRGGSLVVGRPWKRLQALPPIPSAKLPKNSSGGTQRHPAAAKRYLDHLHAPLGPGQAPTWGGRQSGARGGREAK